MSPHPVRIELLALVALQAILLLGCRTECMADEDAPAEQLARERRAAGRAQTVCKELQRPRVELTGDRLVLLATRRVDVAARVEVPSDGAVFPPLEGRLGRYRRHYRAVWPADPFDPYATVEVDPALEAPRAVSLAASVAAAGFGALRLSAGDASVEVVWSRCGQALRALAAEHRTARELAHAAAGPCSN